MSHWLDTIDWKSFDRTKIQPELVALAKAASMVEYNGNDYARYLCEVFSDDMEFQAAAHEWAVEEVKHGEALRRWAELADPSFDFDQSFKTFTEGYKLPVNVSASVRGSRSGELIARCVVETGTSSYYTAIMDYTGEPVLKEIARNIAADEFRHYKLFYDYLKRYLEKENIGTMKRLKIAIGRIKESEDDELAYAFFVANRRDGEAYDRKTSSNRYFALVSLLYRKPHVQKMAAMVMKAAGLKAQTPLGRAAGWLAWRAMRLKSFWSGRNGLPLNYLPAMSSLSA